MPITLMYPNIYTSVVMIVPSMVARGTFFSGFAMLSAGMVAHSTPKNAYRVMVAVVVMAWMVDTPLRLKGIKFSQRIKKMPTKEMKIRGNNFKIVVISCTS